jgi:WD40 repeat protein
LKQETKSAQVRKVSLSPDGRWLAVAFGNRKNPKAVGSVVLWQVDGEALTERKTWSSLTVATAVAFSRDSKYLAWGLAESSTITLWDLDKQQETLIDGHPLGVAAMAFSPDNLLVAGTWDGAAEKSALGIWPVPAGKALAPLTLKRGRPISLTFSADGRRLAHAVHSEKGIKLWHFPDRREMPLSRSSTLGSTLDVAISADGKTVAAAFDAGPPATPRSKPGIKLWDVASGDPYASFLYQGEATPNALVFTPDGKALVAAFEDKVARVYRLDTLKEESVLEGHSSAIFGIDLSRDGTVLATAGADRMVHVWFRSEK